MNFQNRLAKLQTAKQKATFDRECICFPVDEQPEVHTEAERDAVSAVMWPLHCAAEVLVSYPEHAL